MQGHRATGALLLVLASGCAADPDVDPGPPGQAGEFPALVEPADNPSTPEKVALGRLLFYDPILSSDRLTACATCHSEIWGMSDGLPRSIGVNGIGPTGPGRSGPDLTRRNAPTLWNVAYKNELFWDGRSPSLEAQALEPLKMDIELGRDVNELVAELAAIPDYAAGFGSAFPTDADPVTPENLARALAAFQRSFLTRRAPYDRYVAGDTGALVEIARRGLLLFGEAGCASCHTPPLFESPRYADRGLSPLAGVADDGRFEVTATEADRRAFRVPTLRNVRETEPYFHDGSVSTLLEAVRREAERSADLGESRKLADDEIDAIAAFLDKGLTDLSQEPDRPDSVPSGLPVPEDGFRIPR